MTEGGYFDLEVPFPSLDPLEFPTNEGGFSVESRLISDCSDSSNLSIITGYSGLDQIVWFVARHARDSDIKIVFGSEPKISKEGRMPTRAKNLKDEMRDYWLERGLSPRTNSSILETIAAIEKGRVKVKIHTKKFMHAKAYLTDNAAIFGSSNFSVPGLKKSRELNGRFEVGTERYDSIKDFIEGAWNHSEGYEDKLLELLRELQLHSTWQEALARSCAALLEGEWAKDLIPEAHKEEYEKLWPHQKQGIAQSLTILETQGAVVIADPTGSGKTKTGGWLMRLAYNRMMKMGGVEASSLIPVMIAPSSVENNWYQILDDVGIPREVLSQGILSNSRKESSKRRLKLIERTNLLGVDEVHNYYNTTRNRTKELTNNLAESRIFLTATPINKEFKDLVKLMHLLGTEDLDGETFSNLRSLEEKINHPDSKVKERTRKYAKKLVQRFMVRRTRSELKTIVKSRTDEYQLGNRVANYPKYDSIEYDLSQESGDELIIKEIASVVDEITGLCRLKEFRQSDYDKDIGRTESSYIKGRLMGAKALTQWQIWDRLNSSNAALTEHIEGSVAVISKYNLKSANSDTKGMISTLKGLTLPKWHLSESLKESDEIPNWLTKEDEFLKAKELELARYQTLAELLTQLSDERLNSKIRYLQQQLRFGNKVLAFDRCIITLKLVEKILSESNVEVDLFIGSEGSKKGRSKKAEEKYGLTADSTPRIALLSDSMSEGINLQGSSTLIHLTSPTTVRIAEQRAGRLDRMNSLFDKIEVHYPIRDSITSKMKDHLRERCELVGDIIGGNLKLPGDDVEEISEDELDLSHSDLTNKIGTDHEGLFDAFHQVRRMIGDGEVISEQQYEEMRTSKARVMSYIGLVESIHPWCFFVIQTNKNWAPQWVFFDYSKKEALLHRGIFTDIDDICSLLRENLSGVEDLAPSTHADEWVSTYLDHVDRYETNLLPIRRRGLLTQMNLTLNSWQKKLGYHSEDGIKLRELRNASLGNQEEKLDLRQIASGWNDFFRDYRDELNLDKTTKKRKHKKNIEIIQGTPPSNIDGFIKRFEKIPLMESIDSRTIAMIAGVPKQSPKQLQ